MLEEVARGAYELQSFSAADVEEANAVIARYPDHRETVVTNKFVPIELLDELTTDDDAERLDSGEYRSTSESAD